MKIRNLVEWAGANFQVAPGQVIDVNDETAVDRCAANLAEPVEPDELEEARKRVEADRRKAAAKKKAKEGVDDADE